MTPKSKMRRRTATAKSEELSPMVPGFKLPATTECLEEPVDVESGNKSINLEGEGSPLPGTLQPDEDTEEDAEGEGGDASDHPSSGQPPGDADEPVCVDPGATPPSSAAWVPPSLAGASLSFAHGGGSGSQGASLGSGTSRLTPTTLVPFANTPAQANLTLMLVYFSHAGMKVWAMATEGLVTKFDFEEELLYLFVEEVKRRADMTGWMDPLSDCITIQVGHPTYSVLTEYGRLSMDDIIKHARFKFMSHNRHCQNNTQFYYYLEDRDLYVQGIPIGAALFKLLMSKTMVVLHPGLQSTREEQHHWA
eukprot:2090835-Ditylum_brightwellii.AAC.2